MTALTEKKTACLSFFLLSFFCFSQAVRGQGLNNPMPGTPVTFQNAPQRDTSNKTNTNQWADESANIHFKRLYSEKIFYPDTSIRHFHRNRLLDTWEVHLGNPGSPARNLLFTPEHQPGPSLGYHVFDVYRFRPENLFYFNTTRPYSVFSYQLGSKAEQTAEILHTQNISPDWNFALNYRKINAPGYFKNQRTNHDLGNLTTSYTSKDQHYGLNFALVYNKIQNDENGGILSDSFLTDKSFDDRRTIPVRFQNDNYSNRRSAVTNMQRDFSLLLNHRYTAGRKDTLYNEDSTRYSYHLTPRFSVAHQLKLSSEKYQYKDLRPDSIRYSDFFQKRFDSRDSVFLEQKWFYIDNEFILSSFLGKEPAQLQFSAGIGNRFDLFATEYGTGQSTENSISNYLTGTLKKEALNKGQWFYEADAKLFFTGNYAGSFSLKAAVGKDITSKTGSISADFEQQLNDAPYNFRIYQNDFYQRSGDYNKESITRIGVRYRNDFLKLDAGFKNYLVSNFIYLNRQQHFDQFSDAFNISQLWLRKVFSFGIWILDNELAYQQKAGNSPANIPAFMGRHQLSVETFLFGNALKIASGIDLRWHTPYEPAGYSPFFNRFYYQTDYLATNAPEAAVFFNFKIKRFRAFVMGDQLQSLFTKNYIAAPGYPAQNAMIRFGFNWVMIN